MRKFIKKYLLGMQQCVMSIFNLFVLMRFKRLGFTVAPFFVFKEFLSETWRWFTLPMFFSLLATYSGLALTGGFNCPKGMWGDTYDGAPQSSFCDPDPLVAFINVMKSHWNNQPYYSVQKTNEFRPVNFPNSPYTNYYTGYPVNSNALPEVSTVQLRSCPTGTKFNKLQDSCRLSRRTKTCAESVHDPISVVTGNKYESEIDYASTVAGSRLSFVRFYNSLGGGSWSVPSGQSLSIFQSLATDTMGSTTDIRDVVSVTDSEGSVAIFNGNPYEPGSRPSSDSFVGDSKDWQLLRTQSTGVDIYMLSRANGQRDQFDANGRLVSQQWPDGALLNWGYGADGMTVTVTDQFNHFYIVTYELAPGFITDRKRYIQLTSYDGRTWKYIWNNNNRLEKVVYPDSTLSDIDNPYRQYLYGEFSAPSMALTGIFDERGVRYGTWKYDSQGRGIYSGNGPELNCGNNIMRRAGEGTVSYDDTNDTVTVTTHVSCTQSHTATYRFTQANGVRKLQSITGSPYTNCPSGDIRNWTYDTNGFENEVTDKNGNITDYNHNTLGQETQRIEAKGTIEERAITTTWHPTLRLPDTITEPLRTIHFTYDTDGKLLTKTETDTSSFNSGSRTATYTYYPNSLLHTVDGLRASNDVSDITTYAYTAQGFLSNVTNALGQATQITTHNASGQPTTLIDTNNTVTTLTYTPRGWLDTATVTASCESHVTDYDYDAIGQLTRITRADGSYLDYDYNDARRLRTITNNAGEQITYGYDLAGNITSQQITDGASVLKYQQTREFDELNRLLRIVNASGQTVERFGYDKNNNQTLSERGGDAATQFISTYDALDRLKTVTQPGGGLTTYGYDAQNHITSVTDARNVITTYAYDGLGNLRTQTSADTGTTSYQYDAAGNRTRQTDASGVITNYIYDALNRLTNVTYPVNAAKNIIYSYDSTANANHGIGQMTGMQDSSGNTLWNYDEFGRERLRQTTINGRTYSWSMTYDSANRLSTVRYPSGRKVRYVRNTVGQVTGVYTSAWPGASEKLIANNIAYVPFGAVNHIARSNGIDEQRSHNTNYQFSGLDVTGTQTLLQKSYNYYPSGSIETITDGVNANRNQGFIYDKLDRLTKAISTVSNYGIEGYGYDAVGNRTRFERDADANNSAEHIEQHTYATTSNRLASSLINGVNKIYAHNANGQMTNDAQLGATLEYDITNRLVQMTLGTSSGFYTYNGLGQRVSKTRVNNSVVITTHSHYNADGKLIMETQADGKVLREYIYLDGARISAITPTATSDTDNDGLHDAWEMQHFGTLSQTAYGDPDGDGINNYNEFINGSDPYDLTAIGMRGDINDDDIIDVRDVLWMEQHLVGVRTLSGGELIRADLYPTTVGDGIINVQDMLLLQKALIQ